MGVVVFPRLGEWLRARNLSVAELERRIERRFGLAVDPKTLYRLAAPEAVQRADLEIAGAAASVLGIGLDDLFAVEAVPADEAEGGGPVLGRAAARRLAELFDRQARTGLSQPEQTELDALVADYGRRLHERRLRELARRRGVPLARARRKAQAELDGALGWWRAFEADPARRRAVAARARDRGPRAAG